VYIDIGFEVEVGFEYAGANDVEAEVDAEAGDADME
jgi:hypothetical protein